MNTSKQAQEKFWSRVTKTEGCWEYSNATRKQEGYGVFWFQGTLMAAHRYSYTLEHGSIPDGMYVLHKCDNPSCVRPEHLFVGTALDNTRDMYSKGRAARKKKDIPADHEICPRCEGLGILKIKRTEGQS